MLINHPFPNINPTLISSPSMINQMVDCDKPN